MSGIKATPIVYTKDRATNQNSVNTSNTFGNLAKNPQLSANTLSAINLIAGNNQIPHKLARKFSGWTLINKYGPGDVYSYTPTNNYQPELYLYLTSTVAMTVDLSVF
jgi:hypothetical protein